MEGVTGAQRPIYRPEIDGLRALAVGSVILYHANERWMPGGLAGVDVFFVISGYLITSKIAQDIDRGSFSLARFWTGRLRRIAPALLLMLLISSLAALWILPPDHLQRFGAALVASVLPVSNFYFRYYASGYFSPEARTNPLIHTWSLAVEEQFYLVYPLVLLFIIRTKPAWLAGIFASGLLLSLIMAGVLSSYRPDVAFYYLPPRAWELMLGGAVWLLGRRSNRPKLSPTIASFGTFVSMAGLLAGFLVPGTRDTFPWPGAILPCLCTAALLGLLHPAHKVTRMLAAKPFVVAGMMSYSLYLWHQPAFAFARLLSAGTLPVTTYLALMCGIVLVSWASWRFVERPLRRPSAIADARVMAGLAMAAALLIAGGIAMRAGQGWPSRFSAQTLRLMDMNVAERQRSEKCQSDILANPKCGGAKFWLPKIAILGDSHAYAISEGLIPVSNRARTGVMALWRSGCPPILGRTYGGLRERECMDFMDIAARKISESRSVEQVILVARWARHLELRAFDNGEGGVEEAYHLSVPPLDAAKLDQFRAGLERMIVRLRMAGKRVVIVGPVPEVGWSVPDYLWKSKRLGNAATPTTSLLRFQNRHVRDLKMLAQVAVHENVPVVYPHHLFCSMSSGRCFTVSGPDPLYYDDDHLSRAGASLFSRYFERKLIR
jgi:peptidoglycan/LPS O-acetylase OafA/YrhL